ncbi:MAG: 50S ribosomal protein L24 [Patescibacteria group bacterium]
MKTSTNKTAIRFRVGDTVKVMTGKDKGKTGKVTQVIPSIQRVVVEGANKMVKHLRSQKAGQAGQRIEFDAPLPVSNLQLMCPKCGKVTRIGHQLGKEKAAGKTRVCAKCKEPI